MTFVLAKLIIKPHLRQYVSNLSIHLFRPCDDSERKTKSSANNRQLVDNAFTLTGSQELSNIQGKSDKYKLNNNGLRTQRCFTTDWWQEWFRNSVIGFYRILSLSIHALQDFDEITTDSHFKHFIEQTISPYCIKHWLKIYKTGIKILLGSSCYILINDIF